MDQLVVDVDEGPLNPLPGDSDNTAPEDHEGKENLDDDSPQLPRQEELPSPVNGNDQAPRPTEDDEQSRPYCDGQKHWQPGMDGAQTEVGDIPQYEAHHEQDETGQNEQLNEDPLLLSSLPSQHDVPL